MCIRDRCTLGTKYVFIRLDEIRLAAIRVDPEVIGVCCDNRALGWSPAGFNVKACVGRFEGQSLRKLNTFSYLTISSLAVLHIKS